MIFLSRQVDVSQYYPNVLKDFQQFKLISTAENPELTGLWQVLEDVMNDQFVTDATMNGVKRWEKIIKIAPQAADTIDLRKTRILARMNERIPYTYRVLENILTVLCGSDGYRLELKNKEYRLVIGIKNTKTSSEVQAMAKRVVPANLIMQFIIELSGELNLSVGIVTCTIGKKYINLPKPENTETNLFAGIVNCEVGKKSIGLATPSTTTNQLYAGIITRRTGKITIGGTK